MKEGNELALYKTKSNYIEAIKFTRDNILEIKKFTNNKAKNFIVPKNIGGFASCELECNGRLFGVMENKYIVKISDDNFYICSEDSFERTFERI